MENWKGGFLYRYRKWDEFTKKILTEGELFFAPFHSLNDPNEGKKYTRELLKDILTKEIIPKADSSGMKKYVEEQIKQSEKNPNVLNRYFKEINHGIGEMGIVCFTTKPDNNPMWHFYADENRGICIEFYFPESYSPQYKHLCPCPVSYSPLDQSFENLSEIIVFNKDSDWSYEDEVRLIERNLKDTTSRIKKYPINKMLCSVIAGHRMPTEEFDKLKKIIKKINKDYGLKITVQKRVDRKYGVIGIESDSKWKNRHRGLKFINAEKLDK